MSRSAARRRSALGRSRNRVRCASNAVAARVDWQIRGCRIASSFALCAWHSRFFGAAHQPDNPSEPIGVPKCVIRLPKAPLKCAKRRAITVHHCQPRPTPLGWNGLNSGSLFSMTMRPDQFRVRAMECYIAAKQAKNRRPRNHFQACLQARLRGHR